jgi:hypothetical protein
VLNGRDKLKTVCPRTERLSVPVISFHITPWFEREPAFVPFIKNDIINKEPDTVEDNEVEFFPTDPHPFRTGTIIEENGFLFKEREMDGLIFYDSLEVLTRQS